MNNILIQRHKLAEIVVLKNFCRIEDKEKHAAEEENLFLDKDLKYVRFSGRIKNKKVLYFHNNDGEFNDFHTFQDEIIKTDDDEIIKKYYGDPFAQIRISTYERSIKSDADKVTIKIYTRIMGRSANEIYFRKHSHFESFTLNKKTGNFLIVKNNKTTTFRKNSFLYLWHFLENSSGVFKISEHILRTNITLNAVNGMNDEEFLNALSLVMEFKNLVSMSKKNDFKPKLDPESFMLNLIEKFIELKKIKVPNSYVHLITDFYPTEKYLKKNDRKLVAAILDVFKIKSNITIKIIHKFPNIDLVEFSSICRLFGDNYQKFIANIDFTNFTKHSHSFGDYRMRGVKYDLFNKDPWPLIQMNDNEKENVVKVLNSILKIQTGNCIAVRFAITLRDHFDMIQKLKKYIPDLEMNAKTADEFHQEHRELSKQISAMKKGWVIEYQFNSKTIEQIEKPIELKINLGSEEEPIYAKNSKGDGLFTIYPKILKREEEYQEEGEFMHHCVASYADKAKSIIVSFRTENEMDRVTCEFDCQTGMLIQARHFCNAQPPADIFLAVEQLRPTIERIARFGLLHSTEKKKVHLKINGVEVDQEDRKPSMPIFGI